MGGRQSTVSLSREKSFDNHPINQINFVSCDSASEEKESGMKNIGKLSPHETELLETLRIGAKLTGQDSSHSSVARSRHRFSLQSQNVISCSEQANVFKIKRKQNGSLVSVKFLSGKATKIYHQESIKDRP